MLSTIQPVSEQLSRLRVPRKGSTVVPAASLPSLQVVNQQSTKRKTIENHIAKGFNQAYQADITEFMPVLIALGGNNIEAALGIRTGNEKMFVETYFPDSLEQALSDNGIHCPRHRLAEIE